MKAMLLERRAKRTRHPLSVIARAEGRRGRNARPPAAPQRGSEGANGTRRRIVRGARQHFFAHGFRGVTMDDLARELGMSKKTFYQHFANKNSLLEAVMRMKFAEVDSDLAAATARSDKDFPAALQQLLVCMQRHTAELQPAFVRDVRKSAPDFFQKVQARRQDMIQRHFTRLLSAGRKAGVIRKDISLAVAIEILLGATQAVVNPAKVAEFGLTPKSAFDAVIAVFLEGMITGKRKMKL